jgi:hypothetical protein
VGGTGADPFPLAPRAVATARRARYPNLGRAAR